MISSDEYTCAGRVTDVRIEGSLLGLRGTIPILVYRTTLHHIGARAKVEIKPISLSCQV